MVKVVAEFGYWDYGEYAKSAMIQRRRVDTIELNQFGDEFGVKVNAVQGSAGFFNLMFWRMPRYERVMIQVIGEQIDDVRRCVGRIFLAYGLPDEVPFILFGEKRVGMFIVEDLIKEFKEKN